MTTRAKSSRGYILPVVLLLLLVVGTLAASTAQRQSTTARTVQRQIDSYKEHHGAMGLQAAVQLWLQVQKLTSIVGLLGKNGHAFDLQFADGATISVYLSSGQGTALSNLSAVGSEDVQDAARVIEYLNRDAASGSYASLTRSVGPVAIDLVHADAQVVRAAAFAITQDTSKAERLAASVMQHRAGATRNTLSQAGMDADLDNDERVLLYKLITTTPTLWRVHLEVRRGLGQGEVVARYEGLTELNERGTGLKKDFTVSGGFLEWNAVPLDEGPGSAR